MKEELNYQNYIRIVVRVDILDDEAVALGVEVDVWQGRNVFEALVIVDNLWILPGFLDRFLRNKTLAYKLKFSFLFSMITSNRITGKLLNKNQYECVFSIKEANDLLNF